MAEIELVIEALEQKGKSEHKSEFTREEALDVLIYLTNCEDVNTHYKQALEIAIEALEQQKTGKWIDDYKNEIDDEHKCSKHFYRCSECGKYADQFVDGIEDLWDTEKPNFCPNCGARMEVSE